MRKSCEICGAHFDCIADNIENCQCNKVKINSFQRGFLNRISTDCLCKACLQKVMIMTPEINDRIAKAETKTFKAVFPNTTNHYDTLFGGTALQLMDEAAFICATRFSRKKVVTVSSDKVDFSQPIPAGTLVELVANVVMVGKSSIRVNVDIFVEEMYSQKRFKAVSGIFTMVAVDDDKKPISVV